MIPEKLAVKYDVFPIEINDDNLVVGIENENMYALQDLKLATGMNIIFEKKDKYTIEKKIRTYYKKNINLNEDFARDLFKEILETSIDEKASDIHIEPCNEALVIRIRVDGYLKEIERYSIDIYQSLVSVIKLSASMNITERRLPQDGRVDININNEVVDIRVSSIPTVYGEKIVLRILNRKSFLKDKKELGFSNLAIKKINNIINKTSGILLVTGSTGSGKTTTVYSLLNDLKNISKNIMTIEDPVEYKMDGINQIQVNSKLGLSFDIGLRSILRQDPDIIMVGEIRDLETAKIAIRAATTGHLVISTMHTKDAVSSISRLIEMQIPAYLINASLIGIISQKLVRKVCTKCSHDILIKHNQDEEISTKVPKGCNDCRNTGYKGRTAIYEILDINENIKQCITGMKDASTIRKIAIENGMITFEESSKKLIEERLTTLEECIMVNTV
ncbi:GspE/PulE family protein [[Clostridium] dakarense]|uniref:GspE/PulE family protein n=1 Tax=Faecalimicrobium dakarense TaxID=1301100 RepID=UPI0004B8332D|nr:GspE/PulE family protein [[Clostridium] dakarense]